MTIYILNRFVFRPLLAVIKERRKKTIEAFKTAEAMSKEAASTINQYHTKLQQQKDELRKTREDVRQVLAGEEAERLHKTREAFLKTTREAKRDIEAQFKKSEAVLFGEIKELSGEIFKKLLPRGNG